MTFLRAGASVFVEKIHWKEATGWSEMRRPSRGSFPQLVLYFGARSALHDGEAVEELAGRYPGATLLGCTTAGEICGTEVHDGTIVAAAVRFEHTRIQQAHCILGDPSDSSVAGERLARDLDPQGLVHVFVLAEGIRVNGSELVKGLRRGLPAHVGVTGGLAADGDRFEQTTVALNDVAAEAVVAAIGFYGDRLRVGYGSLGGWDPFGPERLITRSEGNVLYELDGAPALDLYRTYLGPYADELPASGLHFPLALRGENGEPGVVRTILGIDPKRGSLVFAGDLPEGGYARLMKANVDRLIDGAHGAAAASCEIVGNGSPDLAILISCVGRKLVLKQRVEEEVESVRDVFGEAATLCGFYSYGEIAPFSSSAGCELHNQTMTITTLAER